MYESLQIIFASILLSSLVTLLVKARHGEQRDALVRRFYSDVRLVWANCVRIALAVVIIVYVQGVIGRTLAFYLHRRMVDYIDVHALANATVAVSPRLFDLGHAITPDMSDSTAIRVVNEGLQYIMFLVLAGVFATPYWMQLLTGKGVKVYTLNMVTRFLVMLSVGHVLRMLCYLTTSLPGPAQHCIVDLSDRKPTKLSDVFFSPHVGGNCGDLIFSGHMLTVVTIFSTVQFYVERMFDLNTSLVVIAALLPLGILQIVNILMLRAHYTVDIVVAVEVAVCLNMVANRVLWVHDAKTALEADIEMTEVSDATSVIVGAEDADGEWSSASENDAPLPLPAVVLVKDEDRDGQTSTGEDMNPLGENGMTPSSLSTPTPRSSASDF